jgi:hypothetical protein
MKVELKQEEWQAVLALLARSPYQEVAQLIQKIAEQLQAPPAAEQPKPHFREVTNG